MTSALRALSAAAEETPDRAATAHRVWPGVVAHVLDLRAAQQAPSPRTRHSGDVLPVLLPNAAGEVSYLYREIEQDPIVWWAPREWQSTIEQWLPLARGNPTCADHLIGFVKALPVEDQVRIGLGWVVDVVLADPNRVAKRTFLLSSWLVDVRSAAVDAGLLPSWQQVVDALVVAGVTRLAPYSE